MDDVDWLQVPVLIEVSHLVETDGVTNIYAGDFNSICGKDPDSVNLQFVYKLTRLLMPNTLLAPAFPGKPGAKEGHDSLKQHILDEFNAGRVHDNCFCTGPKFLSPEIANPFPPLSDFLENAVAAAGGCVLVFYWWIVVVAPVIHVDCVHSHLGSAL